MFESRGTDLPSELSGVRKTLEIYGLDVDRGFLVPLHEG
jgi:hypothetical protein